MLICLSLLEGCKRDSMTIEFTIEAEAHCDGPCGVYDPASARVAGEAVQSMTKKMIALAENHGGECEQQHTSTQ